MGTNLKHSSQIIVSKPKILLYVVLGGLVLLAWSNRFVLDDAFISFGYARNLVEGKGLTWNLGEKVEGYTNFSWTLLMSAPIAIGFDPVNSSYVLSILCFILSLIFTYKLCLLLLDSHKWSLITIALLGTNYSFNSYATSGLETQLQACLFTANFYVFISCLRTQTWQPRQLLALSFLLAAAILTRPDSSLLPATLLPSAITFILKSVALRRQKLKKLTLLLLPMTVMIGVWLTWKIAYYGEIIPNTFYVRVFSINALMAGSVFLYCFVTSYLLLPFAILGIIAIPELVAKKNAGLIAIVFYVLLWCAYVITAGGDFMEFRFLIPIMPLIFILIGWLAFVFIQQKEAQWLLIGILVLGNLHHFRTFHDHPHRRRYSVVETLHELRHHIVGKTENWKKVGEILGRAFNYSPDVSMAITASGTIPYYSRLRTIDMLGLNDKWVARQPQITEHAMTAHQKCAPLSYLKFKNTNLLIAHPWILEKKAARVYTSRQIVDRLANECFMPALNEDEFPGTTQLLEIPIDETYVLTVLYLTKNPLIDDAIARNGWKVYTMIRQLKECTTQSSEDISGRDTRSCGMYLASLLVVALCFALRRA